MRVPCCSLGGRFRPGRDGSLRGRGRTAGGSLPYAKQDGIALIMDRISQDAGEKRGRKGIKALGLGKALSPGYPESRKPCVWDLERKFYFGNAMRKH